MKRFVAFSALKLIHVSVVCSGATREKGLKAKVPRQLHFSVGLGWGGNLGSF